MRKFIAIWLCLMLLAPVALAEGGATMVVDYGGGAVLISEDGTLLTGMGEYDFIYRVTYEDIEPSRVLYCASKLSDAVYAYDSSLDEVEEWPEGEGDLAEGLDMDEVVDEPVDAPEVEIEDGADGYDLPSYESTFFETNSALMDSAGNLLTDFDYVLFAHDVTNAVVFAYRADGFVSALDERGNLLLEGEYAAIVSDFNGGFFATKPDISRTDEYGAFPDDSPLVHVLSDGTVVDTGFVTGTYDLGGFSSGYMCIATFSQSEETFGETEEEPDEEFDELRYIFIDTNGNDAFGKTFNGANNFVGSYAEVTDEEYSERLIDTTGAYVTEKEYSWFDFGVAGDGMPIIANLVDGGFDLLSKDDLSTLKSYEPADGTSPYAYQLGDRLILAFSGDTLQLINAAGEVIYEGTADKDVYTYYNYSDSQPERIIASQGNWPETQCVLMDMSGNVTSGVYQEITALSWAGGEGRYQVASYDIADMEDSSGQYSDSVYDSYRYGVIDHNGNTILEMKYTELTYLSPNRYWVSDGATYQLVDANGTVLYEMAAE